MAGEPKNIIIFFVAVALAGMPLTILSQTSSRGRANVSNQLVKTTSDLINAAQEYKASIEAAMPLFENELKTAAERFHTSKQLYAQGLISKRELESSEQDIKEAQAQLDQARQQITESDQLVAEANVDQHTAEPNATSPSRSVTTNEAGVMPVAARYSGSVLWSLHDISKVQDFFLSQFGRVLPISAFGQSATHNRMKFDHHSAVDVAVHPDSSEGHALMNYLRGQGIPFIAFRSAVPGSATGAHIHVGYPSHKTS